MLEQCFYSAAPIEQLYHQKAGVCSMFKEFY
jgi:hypothetical protein